MRQLLKQWLLLGGGFLLALPVAAKEPPVKFAGVAVQPGKTVSALVPLSAREQTYAAVEGNRVPEKAVAVLAVPPGFDQRKSWPVLIVFSTSDSRRQNRDDVPFYMEAALAEHWLVLAGDGPDLPARDTTAWRAAMTLAALDALQRSFPAAEHWPIACAGISGGAKRACLLAPLLAAEGHRVLGLYLAGINEDLLDQGYAKFRPGKDFLNTKIFITSGQRDKIATPAQTERVQLSFQKNGFRHVRLEKFPEAHNVKRPLTHAALRWFRSESSALPDRLSENSGGALRFTTEEVDIAAGQRQIAPPRVPAARQILITVDDSSHHAPPVEASIYFVARPPGDGPRFIYAHADVSINLRGTAQAQTKIEVPLLKSRNPKKNPPHGFVFAGPAKEEGWIALAQVNGRTFAIRSSDPSLLRPGEGLAGETLEATISDYRSRLQAGDPH